MKVFISREIPDIGVRMLNNKGIETVVWNQEKLISDVELIEQLKNVDAFISTASNKINKDFFYSCSHLKVIAQFAVGYDNIDISEATKLKIPIGNTPDVLSDATADVAFMLMLNVSRKAFYMHKKIIKGEWDFFRPTGNLGIELKNKTLGVFGLGRIGMEMARRCKGAYNMNIIYYNRSHNLIAERELSARKVDFEELLKNSDIISVHSALTEQTRNKFDLATFKLMKKNSIFINTARGAIHNENDLIQALNDKIIWGAGLDVTNPEPMQPDNILLSMSNVAVLPHIGSATEEARNNMAIICAENIIAGLSNKKLPYIVNPEVYI